MDSKDKAQIKVQIKDQVDKFIKSELPTYNASNPLYKQFSSIELVIFIGKLEKHFDIEIHAIEYEQDLFRDSETLTDFILSKT